MAAPLGPILMGHSRGNKKGGGPKGGSQRFDIPLNIPPIPHPRHTCSGLLEPIHVGQAHHIPMRAFQPSTLFQSATSRRHKHGPPHGPHRGIVLHWAQTRRLQERDRAAEFVHRLHRFAQKHRCRRQTLRRPRSMRLCACRHATSGVEQIAF